MRVAVITPFHRPRADWLAQCHASVRAQTHSCTHILVSDGGAPHGLAGFDGQLIELQHRHNDFGDTPRTLGALSAAAQGFDAVAYLDDDNWYYPEHIASLVELHRNSGAAVCTSTRDIHQIDGSKLGVCQEIDGRNFVDTNCFLLTRAAFALLGVWALMPPEYHMVDDMYFCATIRKTGIPMAHSGIASVAYRATWSHIYTQRGLPVPEGVKDTAVLARQIAESGIRVATLPGTHTPVLDI